MALTLTKRALCTAIICSTWALAAAPADATPAWLVPASLTEAGQSAEAPQVAFDSQGNAVAVWGRSDGSNFIVQAASRPAGGSWQTPVSLSEPGHNAYNPRVAFNSQGDAVVVWERSDGSDFIVQAASRPVGGSWQAPVSLSEAGQNAFEPRVAFDSQGDAVAVWARSDGSNFIVQAADRPAGGSWQAPVNLSEAGQDAFEAQIAVDPHGDAVAVWHRFDGSSEIVQAASRPAGGSWQPPVNLSEAGQNASSAEIAFDSQGDAIVVWRRFDGSNEIVQAASRPAGGSWQTPVSLSEAGQNASSPQIAVDSQGEAIAVWQRYDGSNEIVQAATRPAGGAWQPPVSLSEAGQNAEFPQIAFDSQGDAVAVWQRYDGTGFVVQAANLPAGGSWQTHVNLSEEGAFYPQLAFDSQGDAVAVWQCYDGSNYIVQAAAYDAAGPLLRSLSMPTSGTVGQALSFSVSPLDEWSALGETMWAFGDGAEAPGARVTHTYAAAGAYQVTLKSADVLGNATSVSGTVTIAPAPATTTPVSSSRATPPPTNAFQVSFTGANTRGELLLTLDLPGPGSLEVLASHSSPRARASRLSPGPGRLAWGELQLAVSRPGKVGVRLRPTVAGRALLRRHWRFGWALNPGVCVQFTPSGGQPAVKCFRVHVLSRRRVRSSRPGGHG